MLNQRLAHLRAEMSSAYAEERERRYRPFVEMYEGGAPLKQIAELAGVSQPTISAQMKKLGAVRKRHPSGRKGPPPRGEADLTCRAENVLRLLLFPEAVTPDRVSALSIELIQSQPCCGRKTISEIEDWLAEAGYTLAE